METCRIDNGSGPTYYVVKIQKEDKVYPFEVYPETLETREPLTQLLNGFESEQDEDNLIQSLTRRIRSPFLDVSLPVPLDTERGLQYLQNHVRRPDLSNLTEDEYRNIGVNKIATIGWAIRIATYHYYNPDPSNPRYLY